ncbi:type II toxin-antitoxin system PemK/MazF family toxin [Pinibacter soli]|uniref:Type II toxin-antitoxin system PemK/MazF family toxin n=1 Tax=Pinibacter soli TaxID=3044211 RepID=A0ABT6RIJ9_9BACT|nr:type II toxin-antitoxin system PemK/MazF family toxin [Pinibacter soli]MDI3321662.1 type II toxin-antitoxin system PemK/MazF family toxin [Pinibacter soli]
MAKQYQVVLVDLDPTMGSEINKTRPCVIISPDDLNNNLNTVVVAPLTSTIKEVPFRAKVIINYQPGSVVLDQIRAIDKRRIKKIYSTLSLGDIALIKGIIKEMYVD